MKFKIKQLHKPYVIEIAIWFAIAVTALILTIGLHYYLVVYKNTYNLKFADIDGIIKGSPVRLMGVVIGHVRKLNLKDDEINVQIVITKSGVKIPYGSKATVEFTGIIGSKSIEIMPPEKELKEGEFKGIITQNPVRISDFFDSFDIMNQAIGSLLGGADRLATRENLGLLKTFSLGGHFGPIDDVLDGTDRLQKKSSGKMQNAAQILNNLNAKLEKFIEPSK